MSHCRGLFLYMVYWAASCGNGLGYLLRWWALMFLSKGAGTGPIVTQLRPVCAQTYALSARSKFTASRTVANELRHTDIIITKIEYFDLFKWTAMYSLLIKHDYNHNDINHREKMKKIILPNLNGHKLSFKFSLPQQSQRRENASSQCK